MIVLIHREVSKGIKYFDWFSPILSWNLNLENVLLGEKIDTESVTSILSSINQFEKFVLNSCKKIYYTHNKVNELKNIMIFCHRYIVQIIWWVIVWGISRLIMQKLTRV